MNLNTFQSVPMACRSDNYVKMCENLGNLSSFYNRSKTSTPCIHPRYF